VAGQGNISKGFENILELYQYLHGLGYRTDSPLETIGLVTNLAESKRDSPKSSEPVRETLRVDTVDG